MEKYSGPDRRKPIEDDGVTLKTGRRKDDEHCSQHDILWKHNADERKDYRAYICGQVTGMDKEVAELRTDIHDLAKSATPWKVFALSMGVMIASVGWLATKIDKGQDEIKSSVTSIHQRITANDREVESATRGLTEYLKEKNYSVQSIDSRLKTVEKYVEGRGGK